MKSSMSRLHSTLVPGGLIWLIKGQPDDAVGRSCSCAVGCNAQEILAECGSQRTTVAETLRAEQAQACAGRPQPSFSVEQKGIA